VLKSESGLRVIQASCWAMTVLDASLVRGRGPAFRELMLARNNCGPSQSCSLGLGAKIITPGLFAHQRVLQA
jgi:hypothetical protein